MRDNVGGVSSWYRRSICQLAAPLTWWESGLSTLRNSDHSTHPALDPELTACVVTQVRLRDLSTSKENTHCSPITLGHYQHPMCCQQSWPVTRLPPPGLSDTHWLRHHWPGSRRRLTAPRPPRLAPRSVQSRAITKPVLQSRGNMPAPAPAAAAGSQLLLCHSVTVSIFYLSLWSSAWTLARVIFSSKVDGINKMLACSCDYHRPLILHAQHRLQAVARFYPGITKPFQVNISISMGSQLSIYEPQPLNIAIL